MDHGLKCKMIKLLEKNRRKSLGPRARWRVLRLDTITRSKKGKTQDIQTAHTTQQQKITQSKNGQKT